MSWRLWIIHKPHCPEFSLEPFLLQRNLWKHVVWLRMIRLKLLLKEQNNINLFYIIVLFNAGVHRRFAAIGAPASHRSSGAGLSATSAPNGLTSAQLPIFQLTRPGAEPRDRWADLGTDGPGARGRPTTRPTSRSFRSRYWRQLYPLHTAPWSHITAPATRGFLRSHTDTHENTNPPTCVILQTSTEQWMNWWGTHRTLITLRATQQCLQYGDSSPADKLKHMLKKKKKIFARHHSASSFFFFFQFSCGLTRTDPHAASKIIFVIFFLNRCSPTQTKWVF